MLMAEMEPIQLPVANVPPEDDLGQSHLAAQPACSSESDGRERMAGLSHLAAPSTSLRLVPLPRCAMEDPRASSMPPPDCTLRVRPR
jgi:hypothetical protein